MKLNVAPPHESAGDFFGSLLIVIPDLIRNLVNKLEQEILNPVQDDKSKAWIPAFATSDVASQE